MSAETIDGKHAEGEKDALAQIGDSEDVCDFLEHRVLGPRVNRLVLVKRRCEGACPRLPHYSTGCLANQYGLAASLLDRLLGGLRELVGVDGDGGLDLSVIENFEQCTLLAEQAELDNLVEGELADVLGCGDFGDTVEAENLVLDAEDV